VAFGFAENASFGINNDTVSSVVDSLRIQANPVDSRDVALVFKGPSWQQLLPCSGPSFRPIRNVQGQIIAIGNAIPTENGKPQVVADLKENAPTPPLDNGRAFSGGISLRFTRESEQMFFIISMKFSARSNEKTPIDTPIFIHQKTSQTPNDGRLVTPTPTMHCA
jgi:hypothetical protein